MRWTHEIYFSRCSVVTCHKPSHFNSRIFTLDFTWNCCRQLEAKKFSRRPAQFKCVTKETRYYVSIAELFKQNLMSQVAELFRRPMIMLKIPYFSGGHKSFEKSPGIKFFITRVIFFSFIGQRGLIWDRRDIFSKIIDRGSSPEHLDSVCIFASTYFKLNSHLILQKSTF